MISLKTYLITTGAFLALSLIAGIFVWYLYQDMPGARPSDSLTEETILLQEEEVQEVGDSEQADAPKMQSTEEIVITAESLTPDQQNMLKAFGFDDPSFTVTEEMIVCIENAVGEKRLKEIVAGSAPSPLEAVKLVPCVAKQ